MVGAIGWVGGVVNVLPESHVRLFQLAVEQPNLAAARELFFEMLPTLELMEGGGKYTQFVKAACTLSGQPVGPPRAPLFEANEQEKQLLEQTIPAAVAS